MSSKTSPEFILRPWEELDLDSMVKYANNPRIAANLTDTFPHPYSRDDGKTYLAMVMPHKPVTTFAIEIDGEACGSIGLKLQTDIFQKSAECGYWLAEKHWGKGMMPNAVRQIVDYGFETFGIARIFARTFNTNIASQKVLIKAGFTYEATLKKACFKNGQFYDELIYAIVR
ncbi:MAG: GNAT family N-acetyltransferase [Bacteroidales bacterium]